jgi:hypothetical protein
MSITVLIVNKCSERAVRESSEALKCCMWHTAGVSDDRATIAMLKRKRDVLLSQLQLLDEMISESGSSNATNESSQAVESPPIRPDEFKGKAPAEALRLYMHAHRGQKISLGQVADDLMRGSVHPGKARGGGKRTPRGTLIHNLKISLKQRRDIEREPEGSLSKLDPRDIFVRLRPAPDTPKVRQRKPPRASAHE